MVVPVSTGRPNVQPATSRTSDPGGQQTPSVLSPAELKDLRKIAKQEDQADGDDGNPSRDAEARPAGKAAAVSARAQGQGRRQSGRPGGRATSKPSTDRSFTVPPAEFDVHEAVSGSAVLVSADGKILHNLQGPVAEAVYEHLCSSRPRSERPTVWLDHIFGRIPIKALQDYLDAAAAGQGNAIFVRDDGRVDVGTMSAAPPDRSCVYVIRRSGP